MLIAGSDDGVYRLPDGTESGEPDRTAEVERVLEAEQVYRLRQFDGLEGLFATAESGLYYSPDGVEWTECSLPEEQVYAIAASPSGRRLYAGTRPARVFVADSSGGVPVDGQAWTELAGFRDLRDRTDWGIPRHDGVAQLRSLRTHPATPDRIVAGIEVGGIYVSDDRGASWTPRRIEGFDAPHTDDIHHVALADEATIVASTGSGLYRSPDVGRTWERLDDSYRQRYFREAFVADGVVYAGAAPGSSSSWEDDPDHALFEWRGGDSLERVPSPTPEEVVIGWCAVDGDAVAATHRGTLLRRTREDWRVIGTVPTPGRVRGRYLPLTWYEA